MEENIEIWKSLDFLGYLNYEVSNMGQVKSLNYRHTGKERLLKPSKDKDGYLQLSLYQNTQKKTFRVHKLIALAFIPNDNPIEKTEINHLDENKENNHVSNLCWCSCIDNNNYGTRNERMSKTKKGKPKSEEHKQKISQARKGKGNKPILQYTKDMVFIRDWDSATQASEELNLSQGNITQCCRNKQKSAYGYIWRYKG